MVPVQCHVVHPGFVDVNLFMNSFKVALKHFEND